MASKTVEKKRTSDFKGFFYSTLFKKTTTMKLPLRIKNSVSLKNAFNNTNKNVLFTSNLMKRNYACGSGACDGSGGCGGMKHNHQHKHHECKSEQPIHDHAFGQYTSNVSDPKTSGKFFLPTISH